MSRPTLTCAVAGVTASTPSTRNVAADVAEPTADVTESGPLVAPGGTVIITRFAAASVIVAGVPWNDSVEPGAKPLPKTWTLVPTLPADGTKSEMATAQGSRDTPCSRSSWRICRLTDGTVTCRRSAALVKARVRVTASNARSARSRACRAQLVSHRRLAHFTNPYRKPDITRSLLFELAHTSPALATSTPEENSY